MCPLLITRLVLVVAASAAPRAVISTPRAPLLTPRARLPLTALRTASTYAATLCLPAIASAASAAAAGVEHLHTGQKVALFFRKSGLPDWAVLMLISATPAVELRGGVPVGNWMGLPPATTFAICVIGNMLPIAPMILALRSVFFKRLAAPLLKRAEKIRAGLPTGQSRWLTLALFIGVPAPGTGAWTGAIIAYLLDMPFSSAMSSIFSGVVLAGLIMTILTLAGKTGALIALGAMLLAGTGAVVKALNQEANSPDEEPPSPGSQR